MLAHDQGARDAIADMIRAAADDVAREQIARLAHEPPITSRIAQRIEDRMRGVQVFGYLVDVVAMDIPDRGPGALEQRLGADLFVAIRVRSLDHVPNISKGLLIQAKSERGRNTAQERSRLMAQCRKMTDRTPKGAYVWTYGSFGVRAVPASELLHFPDSDPRSLSSRNVAEQFRDVLDCVAGDEDLSKDAIFGDGAALGAWVKEMGARTGVAIDVIGPPVSDIDDYRE